jgi:hypothetical protein
VTPGRVGCSVTALPRFRNVVDIVSVDIVSVVLVILTEWKWPNVEGGRKQTSPRV